MARFADDDVTRTYINCILTNANTGDYSSFDGGKSAMRLMAQCLEEWKAYEKACHQSGSQDFQCNAGSVAIAQTALKQLASKPQFPRKPRLSVSFDMQLRILHLLDYIAQSLQPRPAAIGIKREALDGNRCGDVGLIHTGLI